MFFVLEYVEIVPGFIVEGFIGYAYTREAAVEMQQMMEYDEGISCFVAEVKE